MYKSNWRIEKEEKEYEKNTKYLGYILIVGILLTSLVAQYNNWILN